VALVATKRDRLTRGVKAFLAPRTNSGTMARPVPIRNAAMLPKVVGRYALATLRPSTLPMIW